MIPIARTWGALRSQVEQQGAVISVNDAWVAACCVTFGYPLLTLNRKDFERLVPLGLRLV